MSSTIQNPTVEAVTQVYDDGTEEPAILITGIALDTNMPSNGGAISFLRAPLDDGTERTLVVYAISPSEVADMASNQTKRNAIAVAVQTAAAALSGS